MQGIIQYEDTHEYPKAAGAKVTKLGHEVMAYLEKQVDISLDGFINTDSITTMPNLKIVTLDIETVHTIIPKPSQMHWVVIHDVTNDTYRAIGILTSKKIGNVLLWETQPISGDAKKQFFRLLDVTYILKEKDFTLNQPATEILQNDQKAITAISDCIEEINKKPCKLYTKVGYTLELLQRATLKVKNISNFDVEKHQNTQITQNTQSKNANTTDDESLVD